MNTIFQTMQDKLGWHRLFLMRSLHLFFNSIKKEQLILSFCPFNTLTDRTSKICLHTGCSNSICTKKNAYQAIKNALLSHKNRICTFMRCRNLTYDPRIWLKITSMASTASDRKSAKNPQNSGFLMIHSTLRDQDRSFCCQVNSNIMLSKCFDDMRLLRPLRLLRSLRLYRSLRLLRFLMAGKSSSNQSASSF